MAMTRRVTRPEALGQQVVAALRADILAGALPRATCWWRHPSLTPSASAAVPSGMPCAPWPPKG